VYPGFFVGCVGCGFDRGIDLRDFVRTCLNVQFRRRGIQPRQLRLKTGQACPAPPETPARFALGSAAHNPCIEASTGCSLETPPMKL
jgi:hypothetical protein